MISAIIPVYNRETVIQRAIMSVINQTIKDWEIIIWDDGSSDNTVEKVKEINDSRIRIYSAPNRGVAGARNQAVAKAQGEWIAFLDSDDEWLPEKLEKQIEVVRKKPEIDLVFCSAKKAMGDELEMKPTISREFLEDMDLSLTMIAPDCLEITRNLAENVFNFALSIQSVLIKKTLFDSVGGFNESLRNSEDREFWWRVILGGAKVAVITKPLVRIHRSEEHLSAYSKTYLEHHLYCHKLMIETAKQKGRQDLVPMIEKRWKGKSQEYINTFYKEIRPGDVFNYLPGSIRLSATYQLLKKRLVNLF